MFCLFLGLDGGRITCSSFDELLVLLFFLAPWQRVRLRPHVHALQPPLRKPPGPIVMRDLHVGRDVPRDVVHAAGQFALSVPEMGRRGVQRPMLLRAWRSRELQHGSWMMERIDDAVLRGVVQQKIDLPIVVFLRLVGSPDPVAPVDEVVAFLDRKPRD